MAFSNKPFADIVTFTRGSGATRVNSAGLIVGVDFSTTSNTIATGSKTFTLAADANVNRDWVVGSSVIAVAQAGATGTMTGVVTSYTPSTQVLVLNITSITGSGTSTDWRIGSLEFRQGVYADFDPVTLSPKGGLVEGGATNLFTGTPEFGFGPFGSGRNTTIASIDTTTITPVGSATSAKAQGTGSLSTNVAALTFNAGVDASGMHHYFIKSTSIRYVAVGVSVDSGASFFIGVFDFQTKTLLSGFPGASVPAARLLVEEFSGGWFRFSVFETNVRLVVVRLFNTEAAVRAGSQEVITGHINLFGFDYRGTSSVFLPAGSYIPTTTVSVTRAADQLSVGGTNFSQFYNPSQGTLVMELTPIAQAVGAVAGSLNDGTLNNAIRVQQKQSGTQSSIRKMATDGVTDVMSLFVAGRNVLKSNGIDYSELDNGQVNLGTLGVASSGTGKFLTVGQAETFVEYASASDVFTTRSVAADATFIGAHFGIGRFVLVGASNRGGQHVTVSLDGLAFRRVNIPGLVQALNEITSNGTNQYVAVGNAGVIYTSPDAETWTAQTSGTAIAQLAVHHFGGRYVSGGVAGTSRYSDNGTTWTATTGLDVPTITDIHHNGTNLWVAVGNAGGVGVIYTSPDGITYTQRTNPATAVLGGVHFADGLWVAVGAVGTVVTSPDGITWTDRTATTAAGNQSFGEVNFFNGKFYAVGNAVALYEITAASLVAGGAFVTRSTGIATTFNGIATNGTRLLVCGANGAIVTTEDALTITSRTGNAATLNGAAFGNGTYVVVGNAINGSDLIATVNPTTFEYQRRATLSAGNATNVRFLNGAFYTTHVALGGANSPSVRRSIDGVTFAPVTGNTNRSTIDIMFGNGAFFAVGDGNGACFTSTDGLSFTGPVSAGVNLLGSFIGGAFGNGVFVIVGSGGLIATSATGAANSFVQRTSGVTSALRTVMYSTRDQRWYAAGDNGVILYSLDAITWENVSNDAVGAVINNNFVRANPPLPNLIVGKKNRIAMRIKANDFAVSVNGANVVKDTSVSIPLVDRLAIGMNGVNGQQFNGWINSINYFVSPKSDIALKNMSTLTPL